MHLTAQNSWKPSEIQLVEECQDTGSEVVAVKTNEGRAFAKFLGNREGPHILACEFLGTRMAHHLGLPTFEHAILNYDGIPEIKLYNGSIATAGPAWVVRREEGTTWSGTKEGLMLIENHTDVAKLVALDTWILNCDRYRPDPPRINRNNVFFSREGTSTGLFRLIAMDHSHAFTCGRVLKSELANINFIQEEMIFGLFPEFVNFITREDLIAACKRLSSVSDQAIRDEIAQIPREWEVDAPLCRVLEAFLCQRRNFVATELVARIFPQSELDCEPPNNL